MAWGSELEARRSTVQLSVAGSYHTLGNICGQMQKPRKAVQHLREALRLKRAFEGTCVLSSTAGYSLPPLATLFRHRAGTGTDIRAHTTPAPLPP